MARPRCRRCRIEAPEGYDFAWGVMNYGKLQAGGLRPPNKNLCPVCLDDLYHFLAGFELQKVTKEGG